MKYGMRQQTVINAAAPSSHDCLTDGVGKNGYMSRRIDSRFARTEQVIRYLLDIPYLSQKGVDVSQFHGLIVEMPDSPSGWELVAWSGDQLLEGG